ncbi:unnamed protein product [Linum trigynum]|uniref:Integrase catalytic domain-containing protein n=1 Tax=Linum trigynum TaxID=586398 RepID=A0AAV2GN22_9ROSI
MCEFYLSQGIEHQMSCTYTPEQNGRVERKHQHILNVARALRFHSGVPLNFWSDCVLHAVFIINRLPTPVLNNKSPYEILYQRPPFLGQLRVFGCLAYAASITPGRTKLDPRARQCIFLGIPAGMKGFKLFDLKKHEFLVSRDVTFYEDMIPFRTKAANLSEQEKDDSTPLFPSPSAPLLPTPSFSESTPVNLPSNQVQTNSHSNQNHVSSLSGQGYVSSPSKEPSLPTSSGFDASHDDIYVHETDDSAGLDEEEHEIQQLDDHEAEPIRSRPQRNIVLPARLKDCYLGIVTKYPITDVVGYELLTEDNKNYAVNMITMVEPASFEDANEEECWRKAMQEELAALIENQTWELVKLPAGKKAIGCKCVYKIKLKPDGSVERFKARLVAKGFTQVYGVDFLDTFSLLPRTILSKHY